MNEEGIIIFLMLLCGFGGFVFFVWSIILLFFINSKQQKTFTMLSGLMKQMAELKKSVLTDQKEKPEAKIAVTPEPVKKKIEIPEKHESLKPAAEPALNTPSKSEIIREMAKANDDKIKQQPKLPSKPIVRPPEPRQASAFEEKAGHILKKIWNWIVVGEEFRNTKVSMEYAIASAWLLRAAIIILFAGVIFILQYSMQHGYIGPTGKFAGAVVVSMIMLGFGLKLAGKKYHAIAQGLIGGGIAGLYASIFAGWKMFHILDTLPAFGLMILITIAAGVISIRMNSLLVAIFGVVGGYLTPVLISTGSGNLPALFTYLLILGICTLAIARYKDWKLLNILGYLFTIGLFVTTVFIKKSYYKPEEDFPMVITFLSLFFILYSFIPILYNLINRLKSTAIELMFMFVNSSVFAICSYVLIRNYFGEDEKQYFAVVTISLALFYIAQIMFFMKNKLQDRNFLIILSGLASVFITMTIPCLLSDQWITTAWAIQAVVFMWMSSRIKSNFIRFISHVLYMITFGRMLVCDSGNFFTDYHEFANPGQEYWSEMLNRFMTMGVTIISLGISYFILKQEKENNKNILEESGTFRENDFGKSFGAGSFIARTFFWVAFSFVFIYLHFEFYYFCDLYYPPIRITVLSFIWLGALLYIFAGTQKKNGLMLLPLLIIGIILFMIKLVFVDLSFWELSFNSWRYAGPYSIEDGFMRLLDYIPVVAFFAYAAFIAPQRIGAKEEGNLRSYTMFGILSLSLLFMYSTLELSSFLFDKAPGFRAGGISILWSLFAIAFIIFGILKDSKALRYSGLALFVIVTGKVFFSDMAKLSPLYKIIAFIVLGLIILGGSFVYVKFKDFFETDEAKKEKE